MKISRKILCLAGCILLPLFVYAESSAADAPSETLPEAPIHVPEPPATTADTNAATAAQSTAAVTNAAPAAQTAAADTDAAPAAQTAAAVTDAVPATQSTAAVTDAAPATQSTAADVTNAVPAAQPTAADTNAAPAAQPTAAVTDAEPALPDAETIPKPTAASGFANIRADARGNSIIITWEETNTAPLQQAVIFRAKEPITESSIEHAKLIAKVPAGKKIYTDKVPDGGTYYYGIMPENTDGAVVFVYNPLENTTTAGTATGLSEMTVPADIISIDAQTKDESVIVRYVTSKPGNRLILYRAAVPLTEPGNLVNAVIISVFTDNGVPFIDYPLQGIPCYYGLIDEDQVRTGSAVFTAGKNATTVPVYVKGEASAKKKNNARTMRSIPLPYLAMPGRSTPERKKLDPETEKVLNTIIRKINSSKAPETVRSAYIFPEEQKEKITGEALVLKNIINGSFARRQWNVAANEILKFLELHRSEAVTARCRFYLGQTYYFSGMYREALTEFLFSRSLYYVQSQEWIQYTLNKLDSQ